VVPSGVQGAGIDGDREVIGGVEILEGALLGCCAQRSGSGKAVEVLVDVVDTAGSERDCRGDCVQADGLGKTADDEHVSAGLVA
jgi:hypothetical protein